MDLRLARELGPAYVVHPSCAGSLSNMDSLDDSTGSIDVNFSEQILTALKSHA